MKPTKEIVLDALSTGKLTTLLSAAAIAISGKSELDNPVAPINAISHIMFGEEATREDTPSLKYTGTGLLLHDAACTSWAALHEQLFGRAVSQGNQKAAFAGGGLIAIIAYITDYYLVPKSVTPGMERRLSNRSLFFIYTMLGLGLSLGSILSARRKKGK